MQLVTVHELYIASATSKLSAGAKTSQTRPTEIPSADSLDEEEPLQSAADRFTTLKMMLWHMPLNSRQKSFH